jgi:hypothetical protein
MFERYTEKARRAIFLARYEASQYGSPYIETEHLLLGLLKEDPKLVDLLPNQKPLDDIRREIERHIEPRERISTSVEVPLTMPCKRALHLAAEEANRFASRTVGTEHLLLGLLRISDGLAAQIVGMPATELSRLRQKIYETRPKTHMDAVSYRHSTSPDFQQAMDRFLAALRDGNLESLEDFFSPDSCFVDACGKLWKGQRKSPPIWNCSWPRSRNAARNMSRRRTPPALKRSGWELLSGKTFTCPASHHSIFFECLLCL